MTSLWLASGRGPDTTGTLAFSLHWVRKRVAATAPSWPLPQTTGRRSSSRSAACLAGLAAVSTSGPRAAASSSRVSAAAQTWSVSGGRIPAASAARHTGTTSDHRAALGMRPPSMVTRGAPRVEASSARAPPEVTATRRAPAARPCSTADRVSAVLPE